MTDWQHHMLNGRGSVGSKLVDCLYSTSQVLIIRVNIGLHFAGEGTIFFNDIKCNLTFYNRLFTDLIAFQD